MSNFGPHLLKIDPHFLSFFEKRWVRTTSPQNFVGQSSKTKNLVQNYILAPLAHTRIR